MKSPNAILLPVCLAFAAITFSCSSELNPKGDGPRFAPPVANPDPLTLTQGEGNGTSNEPRPGLGKPGEPGEREVPEIPDHEGSLQTTLLGRVVDEKGEPLPGVKVSLSGNYHSDERKAVYGYEIQEWQNVEVASQSDGTFRMDFIPPPPFQYEFNLSAPGRASKTILWTYLPRGQHIDLGDWILRADQKTELEFSGLSEGESYRLSIRAMPFSGEVSEGRGIPYTYRRDESILGGKDGRAFLTLSGLPLGRRGILRLFNSDDRLVAQGRIRNTSEPPERVELVRVEKREEEHPNVFTLYLQTEMNPLREGDLQEFGQIDGRAIDSMGTGRSGSPRQIELSLEPGMHQFTYSGDPRFEDVSRFFHFSESKEVEHPLPDSVEIVSSGSYWRVPLKGSSSFQLDVRDSRTGAPIEDYAVAVFYPNLSEDGSTRNPRFYGRRLLRSASHDQIENSEENEPRWTGLVEGVMAGQLSLVIKADDSRLVPSLVEFEWVAPNERRSVQVEMIPGGVISGRVQTPEGQTSRASVALTRLGDYRYAPLDESIFPSKDVLLEWTQGQLKSFIEGYQTIREEQGYVLTQKFEVADEEGRFRFEGLPSGRYQVRAGHFEGSDAGKVFTSAEILIEPRNDELQEHLLTFF